MTLKKIIFASLLFGLFVFSIFLLIVRPSFAPDPNPVLVKIPKGASAQQTAKILGEKGVLNSPSFFLLAVKVRNKSGRLQHGSYLFERNHYLKAMRQLENGITHSIKVTIPEGWTSFQIAERLKALGILSDAGVFESLAQKNNYEGMLFPNTYFFEPLSDPEEIVQEMLAQFNKAFSHDLVAKARGLNFSLNQALTLASIIEREAQINSERPFISSVYHNRLKKGIRLAADPTVQYALSGGRAWKDKLYYRDLEVDSPYNTYRYPGLPPGPICNPGLKSMEAALSPASTPYLFFVADGKGGHKFFATYREHIKNQLKKSRTPVIH